MLVLALFFLIQTAPVPTGEDPIAPYAISDANAGGSRFKGVAMFEAFHGVAGIERIIDDLITTSQSDPRIGDIFTGQDMIRLRRTLKEQSCVLLNRSCHYTGRDVATAHKNLGIRTEDMNTLVEKLQATMRHEDVTFRAQNALLAKLAVMRPNVVTR